MERYLVMLVKQSQVVQITNMMQLDFMLYKCTFCTLFLLGDVPHCPGLWAGTLGDLVLMLVLQKHWKTLMAFEMLVSRPCLRMLFCCQQTKLMLHHCLVVVPHLTNLAVWPGVVQAGLNDSGSRLGRFLIMTETGTLRLLTRLSAKDDTSPFPTQVPGGHSRSRHCVLATSLFFSISHLMLYW